MQIAYWSGKYIKYKLTLDFYLRKELFVQNISHASRVCELICIIEGLDLPFADVFSG